ncbi:MAG: hypothetical protein ACI38Z_03350 [Parafannyhessea sp.]|uniref:hypothetical protein n=1 Tax=Parafannyhessea sp. TaxID=2847324 RepID=UPI003F04ADA3
MGSEQKDPMEALVGLAVRVIVAVLVFAVAFEICEQLGMVPRAIACAAGVAVMAWLPLMGMRTLFGPEARLGRAGWSTYLVFIVTLAIPLVAFGMQGSMNGGTAAVIVLVPGVAFLASLGRGAGSGR